MSLRCCVDLRLGFRHLIGAIVGAIGETVDILGLLGAQRVPKYLHRLTHFEGHLRRNLSLGLQLVEDRVAGGLAEQVGGGVAGPRFRKKLAIRGETA